ncbi:MAG: outer membrane protein transport protein [bacterium]
MNGKKPLTAVFLACSACVFFFPFRSQGAWIESLGQSARASAMGNAYIAVADDLSAVWYNPAGLTQLIGGKKVDHVFGVAVNTVRTTIDEPLASPRSGSSHYDGTLESLIPILHFNFGLEIGERIYLAPFPFYVTHVGGTKFPETIGDARFSGYFDAFFFMNWMPTIAYRLHEKVSVGVGLHVNAFNQIKAQQKLGDGYLLGGVSALFPGTAPENFTGNPILSALFLDGQDDGKLLIRTDSEFPTGIRPINDVDINFKDLGFGIGVLFEPTDWLRIGTNYRSEMAVHTEGEMALLVNPSDPLVAFTQSGILFPPVQSDTERFDLVFRLPTQLGFGIAIEPLPWLLWSVDYTWTDWGRSRRQDELFIRGDGLGPPHVTKFVVPRHWKSVHSVRTGAEVRLSPRLSLQGGFWYDPSPVPDRYYSVTSGMNDYFIYSFGAGYRGLLDGRLDVNTFFLYLASSTRRIAVGESQILGGVSKFANPLIGVSPNRDFSMEVDGDVITWGVDFTMHF